MWSGVTWCGHVAWCGLVWARGLVWDSEDSPQVLRQKKFELISAVLVDLKKFELISVVLVDLSGHVGERSACPSTWLADQRSFYCSAWRADQQCIS